jgi:hypothetical protein
MKTIPPCAGPGPTTLANAVDRAWTRPGVTVRLSDRRRALLRALAKECSPPLSPTLAIDRAISLATQAQREMEDGPWTDLSVKMAEIASLVKRGAAEDTLALGNIELGIRRLGESLAYVLAEGNLEAHEPNADPPSIRAWVEQEAKGLPRPSFLAKALWRATKRIDYGHVAVDLLVDRVAAAGLRGPDARGAPALVRIGSIGNDSPLARCDPVNSFYLMFQAAKESQTWGMSLHNLDAAGRLGPATSALTI